MRKSANKRVLARRLAAELTPDELRRISGSAKCSAITLRAPDYNAEFDTIDDPPAV